MLGGTKSGTTAPVAESSAVGALAWRREPREDVAIREIGRAAFCLSLLGLCATTVAAADTISKERLDLELPREKRQHRILKELLGRDRWRRLNQARFKIALHDHGFTPGLSDNPDRHEDVSGVLLRSLGRIGHKAVLKGLRLEERRDSLRAQLRRSRADDLDSQTEGRPKLRFSPRFRLDSSAWVGAKLRLARTGSRLWSGTSLRLGSELDGHNPSVKLGFEDHSRRAFLIYNGDHDERGESVELLIGFYF